MKQVQYDSQNIILENQSFTIDFLALDPVLFTLNKLSSGKDPKGPHLCYLNLLCSIPATDGQFTFVQILLMIDVC